MNLCNYARLFCSPTFISKYDTRFWRIINFFSPLIYKQNRFPFFDINTAGNHFCTYKYIKNTELILIEFLKHLSEVALTIQWGWMIFKPCIR